MKQGYLAQESLRVNKATRKRTLRLLVLLICALSVLYFLGKDSIDFTDVSLGSIPFILLCLVGVSIICTVINIIAAARVAVNGKNLHLPYGDNTQEAAAAIIDREATEGKLLVDEYIYEFKDLNKAYGEKVVLTPSYLLLSGISGRGGTLKVTAIPFHKIYWVCAQAGTKGGPYVVRLLIFTEQKMYALVGVDIEHVQKIADQFYQYIPNLFSGQDPFVLSYEFEKMFAKNRAEFITICETERKNLTMK